MKGSDHLIKLAFERRVRTAWPIRWGGGSARKLVAAPKDHLFVIVDARLLKPGLDSKLPPIGSGFLSLRHGKERVEKDGGGEVRESRKK